MIRNIIFDIGGVLLDYNPKTYLDKLNIEEGKRKELNDIIFHKYKNEIEQILSKNNLKYMLPPKQEMIEYYKTLKQKEYKIYLCSNITRDTYNYIKDNFEIIQIADGGAFSCFENISKPNAEIYHKLIEKYNLNKEESILIDDTKRNIISSNDIGLKGILFNNIEDIKKILK